MIKLAIKKILHNKVLMLSLFAGFLIAVIIAGTIPIYSAGIAHRMFVTQMETYQNENLLAPGGVTLSCSLASFGTTVDGIETVEKGDSTVNRSNFEYCTDYLENELYPALSMPAMVKSITLSSITLTTGDSRDVLQNNLNRITIRACNTYENAVEIISGRMPSDTLDENGCIEVMISRVSQQNTGYTVGCEIQAGETKYDILNSYTEDILKLKVVGVFEYSSSPVNPLAVKDSGEEIYCDYSLFKEHIFDERNFIGKVCWYYAGDYTKFDLDKTESLILSLDNLNKKLIGWGLSSDSNVTVPPVSEYREYSSNIASVNILLTLFYAPILILVAFFIFMISEFTVENDKNEIAMLNSRGASRWQIVLLYMCQGGMLVLISVIIAPFISRGLCSLLGATSGFLEFSQRAPIKLKISFSSVAFGAVAGLIALLTMLVPVYKAAGVEIVVRKRSKFKKGIVQNAVTACFAVITGVIASYSYYVLVKQKEGIITSAGKIQPLAYLLLICFFACIALVFILIYPFVLRLTEKLLKKNWKAEKYLAYSHISRMMLQEKFIIIFLSVTVAIGAFSSVSASTMNINSDRSATYANPCDMIIDLKFSAYDSTSGIVRKYFYSSAKQTEATRIVCGNSPILSTPYGNSVDSNIQFMGIDPDEFASIVTVDDSCLEKPFSTYMQMLKNTPDGCIISKNTAETLKVNKGDKIYVNADSSLKAKSVMYLLVTDIIEAFPTYYSTFENSAGETENKYLVIVNRDTCDASAQNQNYRTFLNTEQEPEYFKSLAIKNGVRISEITNCKRNLYLAEIDSVRQAINGALTLGFLAVTAVCAIGFAIYWIISVKSRTLQIGTMRALGLSLGQVKSMVFNEQALICVLPIILGMFGGIAGGALFAPLLQSAFSEMGSLPPYTVSVELADMFKLAFIILVLVGIGTYVAVKMLKYIKAASAIKLGEE